MLFIVYVQQTDADTKTITHDIEKKSFFVVNDSGKAYTNCVE